MGLGLQYPTTFFSYPWLPRSIFPPRVTKWSKFIDEFYGACGNPLTSSMQSFCRNCSRSSCFVFTVLCIWWHTSSKQPDKVLQNALDNRRLATFESDFFHFLRIAQHTTQTNGTTHTHAEKQANRLINTMSGCFHELSSIAHSTCGLLASVLCFTSTRYL